MRLLPQPQGLFKAHHDLITVVLGLVWAVSGNTKVFRLIISKTSQINVKALELETSNFLVKLLGEEVNANIVLGRLGPEGELSEHLIGERRRHNKGRMAISATEVDKTALREEEDSATSRKLIEINLRLDVSALGVSLQPLNVNLNIEVTDIANNSRVLHLKEMLRTDDIAASSGGNKDVTTGSSILHRGDFITLHDCLKSIDGVNFGNNNTSTLATKRLSTALSDITITSDNGNLSGNHDVGGTLNTVQQRLAAAIEVIELGLSNRVVNVDSRNLQLSLLKALVKVVYTSSGLFRDTLDTSKEIGVAIVNNVGKVASVVEDHVKGLAIGEEDGLLNAPLVLLLGLALPGIDGDASGSDSGSSVVLSRENVARRPSDLSTESSQGLDENGSLDGHMKAAGNPGALKGLRLTMALAKSHKARHFLLSEVELLTTPCSKVDVSHLVGGTILELLGKNGNGLRHSSFPY